MSDIEKTVGLELRGTGFECPFCYVPVLGAVLNFSEDWFPCLNIVIIVPTSLTAEAMQASTEITAWWRQGRGVLASSINIHNVLSRPIPRSIVRVV